MEIHFSKTINILFKQLYEALLQIDDDMYKKKFAVILNASIGEHVRHIIEHFQELHAGYTKGTINYGNRKRDYTIETNISVAISALSKIITRSNKADKKLVLCVETLSTEDAQSVTTTYARELYYNIEHTVHHMAIIRIPITTIKTVVVPDSFGVAASTVIHRKKCVQ